MANESAIVSNVNRLHAHIERTISSLSNFTIDDTMEVLRRTMERYVAAQPRTDPDEDLETLMKQFIISGARANNPGSQKLMMDIVDREKAKDYMNNLVINITPYDVEDAKLTDIIAECDIDIFEEMMEAGNKRLAQIALEKEIEDDFGDD